MDSTCEEDCVPVETLLGDIQEDDADTLKQGTWTLTQLSSTCKPSPSQSEDPPTTTKQKRRGRPCKTLNTIKRSKYSSRFANRLQNTTGIANNHPESADVCPEEDQYTIFGKHIVSQMRELPVRSFIQLQNKIQQLITDERLNQLDDSKTDPVDVKNKVSPQLALPDNFEPGKKTGLYLINGEGKLTKLKMQVTPS